MAGYVSKDGREQYVIRTKPEVMDLLDGVGKAMNGGTYMPRGKVLEEVLGRVVVVNEMKKGEV